MQEFYLPPDTKYTEDNGYRMYVPDVCVVIKLNGTYDVVDFRYNIRTNGTTREEALAKWDNTVNEGL